MKFTQHYFEGTADEFRAVAHLFQSQAKVEETKEKMAPPELTVTPVEAIRAMLTRRPISDGQMALYKALADGQISHPQLLKRMNRTADVMAGVMGSLGRRINQTPEIHQAGLPGNTKAVALWEVKDGKWFLELTAPAQEALKAEGII